MKPLYQNAEFMLSTPDVGKAPPDQGWEVAFVGRSNAGKSSALNALTGRTGLARTSKTPGRTQLLNFFRLDDARRLVDLPGYGFARVPVAVKQRWQASIAGYLNRRASLRGLVLVMDVRHPLKDLDRQLLSGAMAAGLPCHALLTKADKLAKGRALDALRKLRVEWDRLAPGGTVQLFSATTRQGVEELQGVLDAWLEVGTEHAER